MRDNPAHQEERREELIGGKIVMMAPASAGHLYISNNIYRIFGNYSVRLLLVRKTRHTGPRPAIWQNGGRVFIYVLQEQAPPIRSGKIFSFP